MKEYDVIAIGSGSSMNIISAMLRKPGVKAAVIEKDDPGGICLTRGCIPTKILVYPAELVRMVDDLGKFGIDAPLKKVDFAKVMQRMRDHIRPDIEGIRKGLSQAENIDYYPVAAEFTAPYTLKVGNETITSKLIFLCIGSEVRIPPVKGLDSVGYHTSDTVLGMTQLPASLAIIGGGYIAAEYGHFFSAMGSKVTIVGRNPQFLPQEEPEVSELALKEMGKHMTILTDHEVLEVRKGMTGKKKVVAKNRASGITASVTADEILVATGRGPNTDILHPEKAGIEVDEKGWIKVNEYLETNQPGIWAFGDATGKHLFKHVANYESLVVYQNAILGNSERAEYHAVPHAVFTHPEIAGVGMREKEAVAAYGEERVGIGFQRFEDTAKGQAMGVKDYFVKVIIDTETGRILGAHIIGPQASVLIQEIINLMYTPSGNWAPARAAMHIHPGLSEVVERAFQGLMSPEHYHHMRSHHH
ncbi:MAG: dihydrolipoamide dehydrogenase [Candidatus Proteinoplasmatales archaeon SG8-5]|nr:MAG: dihydrolipoamide dehydrogenase [Candidatus Proteinoplasmatales archaeon SG8-5]